MKPYYDDGTCVIYHGDAREFDCRWVTLDVPVFLLTDPPYGIEYESSRGELVTGDDLPFDPVPWICRFPDALIWGANHFARYPSLEVGRGLIVWNKRDQVSRALPGSDCEIAWTSATPQVRLFTQVWIPHTLREEQRFHPTQKPTKLHRSLISEFVRPAAIVFDPFMGSGTTLRAAKDLGRIAIGIEIEERYCEIAAKRLAQEVLPFGVLSPERNET